MALQLLIKEILIHELWYQKDQDKTWRGLVLYLTKRPMNL